MVCYVRFSPALLLFPANIKIIIAKQCFLTCSIFYFIKSFLSFNIFTHKNNLKIIIKFSKSKFTNY